MSTLGQAAAPAPDSVGSSRVRETVRSQATAEQVRIKRRTASSTAQLSHVESVIAFAVFVTWLALFAAGILVKTEPFRCEISSGGVTALKAEGSPRGAGAQANSGVTDPCAATPGEKRHSKIVAWVVVLLCFLPLNLAWVCATAGALGAFGNRANLSDDHSRRSSVDNTNPYTSAMLRGFFVYLFMISGLLLLDDSPFSNPAPGQYIRLAGFLSLSSFVVSYQPRLFSMLIVWAFHRIQVRDGEDPNLDKAGTDTLHAKKTTIEVTATQPHTASPRD